MSRQLRYIISLFIVVIAAAHTANAQSISVELAEKTPPLDENGQFIIPPTTTTTTTTTTLPVVPRCPDGITAAMVGSPWEFNGVTAGSESGYDYWQFHDADICDGSTLQIFCIDNPQVDISRSDRVDWESINGTRSYIGPGWEYLIADLTAAEPNHSETCFICGCYRSEGCFAPGVKITMADGSLRNIEDVRAGDLVRNAKSGAAVKVGKVIEGPEALPLLRFGFDGATVTTSQAHPVLTAAGLRPANKLKKGDTIFDAQGNPHLLTILETLPIEEGQRVINVNLDTASSDTDARLIISDGIITGDIVLQGLLKEKK